MHYLKSLPAKAQILNRSANVYDAVIVGSGCTGGVAAKQLTQAGLKVCVLEAGGTVTEADFSEHIQGTSKYRSVHPTLSAQPAHPAADTPAASPARTGSSTTSRTPYTYAKDEPFQWIRMRVLSGRFAFWAPKLPATPISTKAASRDGYTAWIGRSPTRS
ncbi:MAG: hypothetical protein R2724_27450 [Bryobacterales bacterium]